MAVNETEYLRPLTEISASPSCPTIFYVDITGAYDDASNRTGRRTRHMNLRFHRVREATANNVIKVIRVRGGNDKDTSEMLADVLTKATNAPLFVVLSRRLIGDITK